MQKKNKAEPAQSLSSNDFTFNPVDVTLTLQQRRCVKEWLIIIITKEGLLPGVLSFNFCSDRYLNRINKKYLNHSEFTDIITFDLSEGNVLSGDIYISVDRVKDNAHTLNIKYQEELRRVIVHGVLHLCGFNDKSSKDRRIMRVKEDTYLSLFHKISGFHVKTRHN